MPITIDIPSELHPLLPFETKFLEAISKGEACRAGNDDVGNEVRAKLLRYLCTSSKISGQIHSTELHLEGANISGPLNLKNCEIKYLLRFINCHFHEPILLSGAELQSLDLSGSFIESLEAPRLHVQFSLLLCESEAVEQSEHKPFSASGQIDLSGAVINGNLNCDGGQFRGENEDAFIAEHITVGNSFLLRKASIDGRLDIMNATIGGNFECDGLIVCNAPKVSILAENINVKGNVHLRTTIALNGKADTEQEHFFISEGELRFNKAKISGNFDCQKASLKNLSGVAFTGDGMQVDGAVLFRNFIIVDGEVRLYEAQMSELDCTRAAFNNPDGVCFIGDYMNVKNAFKLFEASCKGRVSLLNAKVTHLMDTYSSWPQEPGSLELDGFQYEKIYSEPAIGRARLKWLALQFPRDDWQAKIRRFGNRIYNKFEKDPSKRRKILLPYTPSIQPYEQLISVLKKMGWYDEARTVQIAKNQYITKYSTGHVKLGRWVKSIVDYGYSPVKALIPIILIIAFGVWMFTQAAKQDVITPTNGLVTVGNIEYPYPQFNPILYSVDVFLPIVDLHQESLWIPNTGKPGGQFYMYYMIFHITAGWFFTTLFVAAVSGLVKAE